jgi:hypothetical protein
MRGDGKSYCTHQLEAELKICVNCRRAVFMTVPCYEICMACRAGCPPLGPVIPPSPDVRDVNGVVMTEP